MQQQPPQFSLYGAVDLGARQAAAQRRQQAARSGSQDDAGPGGLVFDTTEEMFAVEVVERSRTVPVIVDLWADWCEPCKQLSPVLERLAAEGAGSWVLAKIDVDANPQLSAALRVQSIPMVVAVVAGQMIDGFLGALPEAQVREWLSQVLAAAEQLGVRAVVTGAETDGRAEAADGTAADGTAADGTAADGTAADGTATDGAAAEAAGGPGRPGGPAAAAAHAAAGSPQFAPGPALPPEYEAAQQAMERGDLDAAAAAFEQILAAMPSDPVARLGLAQVELFRRISSYDESRARREAAEHPDDVAAQCRVADLDLSAGKIEQAFDRMLGTIRRTTGEERDQARAHLVSLFDVFPPREPRVARARATLSTLLF